jgi:mRNA-degrading endonuclease toxin of MazEF toxin-antitoxin module
MEIQQNKKDFVVWNALKQNIHCNGKCKFYHVREIWWCALGVNIGCEQNGSGDEYRRPVLIMKGLGAETCLVVPLTTSVHKHFLRPAIGIVDGKEACALLSQIRVVDTRRLVRKIGYLQKGVFEAIRKAAKEML